MTTWRKFSAGSMTWLVAHCAKCKNGVTFTRVNPEACFHHCGTSELVPLAVLNGAAETPQRKSVVERAVQDQSEIEHAVSM